MKNLMTNIFNENSNENFCIRCVLKSPQLRKNVCENSLIKRKASTTPKQEYGPHKCN